MTGTKDKKKVKIDIRIDPQTKEALGKLQADLRKWDTIMKGLESPTMKAMQAAYNNSVFKKLDDLRPKLEQYQKMMEKFSESMKPYAELAQKLDEFQRNVKPIFDNLSRQETLSSTKLSKNTRSQSREEELAKQLEKAEETIEWLLSYIDMLLSKKKPDYIG